MDAIRHRPKPRDPERDITRPEMLGTDAPSGTA